MKTLALLALFAAVTSTAAADDVPSAARWREIIMRFVVLFLVLGILCFYPREADEGDDFYLNECERLLSHEQPACVKKYSPPWR